MAKMFYTLEETKTTLGRNEEGIKQLSREGRLREFRDGPKLMFKADQVEALKAEISGGGAEISLVPEEPAAGESRGGSSLPGVEEVSLGGSVADVATPKAGGTGSGLMNLGGSAAGSGAGSGAGLSSHGTRGGITVFDAEERVDPSAQTAISPSADQLSMEAVGSGSGLLDLTRESDDTSLGAVFDEMAPGKTATGRVSSALDSPTGGPTAAIDTRPRAAAVQNYVAAPDPWGAALGVAAIVPIVCMAFACFLIGANLMGSKPEILDKLAYPNGQGLYYFAGAVVATLLFLAGGYFVANATTTRK